VVVESEGMGQIWKRSFVKSLESCVEMWLVLPIPGPRPDDVVDCTSSSHQSYHITSYYITSYHVKQCNNENESTMSMWK
jgi:hypothetical protein